MEIDHKRCRFVDGKTWGSNLEYYCKLARCRSQNMQTWTFLTFVTQFHNNIIYITVFSQKSTKGWRWVLPVLLRVSVGRCAWHQRVIPVQTTMACNCNNWDGRWVRRCDDQSAQDSPFGRPAEEIQQTVLLAPKGWCTLMLNWLYCHVYLMIWWCK